MPSAEGSALAGAYAVEVVAPLLERLDPGLPFSTARLGSGSDVLGLDDATSRDHDWGLRLTVVVPAGRIDPTDALLEQHLPSRFQGLPTRFATTWDPQVRHRAEVVSLEGLAQSRAGIDPRHPLTLLDWISLTGQAVLELTAGPVFRDHDGALGRLRADLAKPPDDLRKWAVASAWAKLAQELPFIGRAADRGDETGSRAITARLAQTAMRLGFLLEGRWAPYSKWLGTAFAALPNAGPVIRVLDDATAAARWREREAGLVAALDRLARLQSERGLPSLRPATEPFWDRPYRGVRTIAALVRAAIDDPVLRAVPLIGPPDLWSDDVTVLVDHGLRRRMVAALLAAPATDELASRRQ